MQVSPKLRTASSVMAWLSLTGAVVMTIAPPVAFLVPNPMIHLWAGMNLGIFTNDVSAAIPLRYRAGALAVEAVPISLMVWSLVVLFRLFRFYAAGQVFETPALRCLTRVTALLFWFVLAHVVAESARGAILHAAAGHPGLTFSFSTPELGLLFLAGVALVIARVMAEAKRLADENATFI